MPNDDLISRKALLDSFDVHKVTEYDEVGFAISYNAVPVEVIEKAPAVDAEPVRHGKWINGILGTECSYCSSLLPVVWCPDGKNGEYCAEIDKTLFCPDCGAIMDSKEDTKCTPQ